MPIMYNSEHTSIDGDCITTPDVLRVDVCEAHVLNDDVLDTTRHTDTLALDDTLVALADQGLVGLDGHPKHTCLVVGNAGDFGRARLVVVAPSVLVDGNLARGASSPWSAATRGYLALSAGKVKCLGQNNDTWRGVAEVAHELRSSGWVHRSGVATTSHA